MFTQSITRDERAVKAAALVASNAVALDADAGTATVRGARGAYTVDLRAATCTCPDFRFRGATCKHLRAARLAASQAAAAEAERAARAARWSKTLWPDYRGLEV
jgi:predicted nucleic acid-binding Zn finger protein